MFVVNETDCYHLWNGLNCYMSYVIPSSYCVVGNSCFHVALLIERTCNATFSNSPRFSSLLVWVLSAMMIFVPFTTISYDFAIYLPDRAYCANIVSRVEAQNSVGIMTSIYGIIIFDLLVTIGDILLFAYNKYESTKYRRRISDNYTLSKSFNLREFEISISLIWPFSLAHSIGYSALLISYVDYVRRLTDGVGMLDLLCINIELINLFRTVHTLLLALFLWIYNVYKTKDTQLKTPVTSIFGLCTNYAYIIFLSAAESIMNQGNKESESFFGGGKCLEKIERRTCTTESLGYVLLADIVPCLILKMIYPFIGKYIPMTLWHVVVCILQAASFIIVAFAPNTYIALIGVGFASAGSGLGESFYLGLTSFYSSKTIAAWSSGTGGAGLFGSLTYALLTEPHLANLSPRTTMLIMLVVPAIFFLTYFTILTSVPTIHDIAVSQSQFACEQRMLQTLDTTKTAIELNSTTTATDGESNDEVLSDASTRTAEEIKFIEKVRLVMPMVRYMIPLTLIYFAEYLINQGLIVFLVFDCAHALGLSRESQYRWYQALYQIGVFISRSSVHFFRLPLYILILLTVLQWMNTTFFFFDAIYAFVPHICIIFALILFEGFFGGASYVNTFYQIHVQIHPLVREFSLSFATLADGIGIVLAGIFAIPTHNFVCKTLLH